MATRDPQGVLSNPYRLEVWRAGPEDVWLCHGVEKLEEVEIRGPCMVRVEKRRYGSVVVIETKEAYVGHVADERRKRERGE